MFCYLIRFGPRFGPCKWSVHALDAMRIEKPKHTVFTPELVISELLQDDYPPWKKDTHRESVEWVMRALKDFFDAPKRRGCILNLDNQMLHQKEMEDSRHVASWVCSALKGVLKGNSTSSVRFQDACVPVLHTMAFRGAETELQAFLKMLRSEFAEVLATIDLSNQWTREEVVQHIHQFEKKDLPRSTRCTAARVLTKHPILFGGMVYASAFALASLRLQWMERRTKLMMDAGVIPIVR